MPRFGDAWGTRFAGCGSSRWHSARSSGSYGCAFASSEQLPGLPPARMHTRYSHGSTKLPAHMPYPACSASRWIVSNFPFEYCGQSRASPLPTSHSARSVPATEHEATGRPYWSSEIGMHVTGRLAMRASRSFAAFTPHRYCKLSSPRQS
jgi:hypothetical protein